jgi:hypothetical protein
MSSTRRASDGFHQERYCSAEEFSRGLLANVVAKRCELVKRPEDRELIWFLQLLSHRCGLDQVAAEVIEKFPDRIAAPSMRPPDPRQEQAKRLSEQAAIARRIRLLRDGDGEMPETPKNERRVVVNVKNHAAEEMPKLLARICTDPSLDLQSVNPWYFKSFVESLRDHMRSSAEAIRRGLVVTEIGKAVEEELDYALESGCMTVTEGLARTGKSFSARAWCEAHPGRARFVQVPSFNDDIGFFRKIAEAIGSASALSLKGVQLRERIEAALQSSKLMLVLDEAHYLWPQNNRREALPGRVNWIMTALVNHGVPVALLTTPQFMVAQKVVEKRTGWTSEQFVGRIGHYKKLPGTLNATDLAAVARYHFPEGDKKTIEVLVLYAQASAKYLAAIETTVKRARFLASKERREPRYQDFRNAITENDPPMQKKGNGIEAAMTVRDLRSEDARKPASLTLDRTSRALNSLAVNQ